MLNIDDKYQEKLFRILESNKLFDSWEDDFSSSSDYCDQSTDETFDSPNIKIGCRDSYCNVIKTVNVLTKSEENESLLIILISLIENPELQKEYLDKLKKNLIKDENVKKLKSTISFEETLERFNKRKSKNFTVNDLQHEITVVKQEIIKLKNEFKIIKSDNNNLKQEMLLSKIDKNLNKHQSDNEQDEHRDRDESSQQALLSDKGITDDSQLNLVNKRLPPKWFTKVKIVVSHDYHFNVIVMIDSSVDMNCIQEELIPSKYFEKSTERLVSTNGTQIKIKYELNDAHVCHDNVCFKIPSVLVKNMTGKVILGLPFINALYPFLIEHDGITIDPFGQKVKFKFTSKFEIDTDDALNLIHAKTKHLNSFKQEVDTRKLLDNFLINYCYKKLIIFKKS